ncbi:NUDIX domain-containing protein [Actinoplanes philippinensis]|uniref:NUDIX domain-containing protein n=1 Tax=Actinoplanes philippinensis TaxID=35752 RepID=UPI0033D46892
MGDVTSNIERLLRERIESGEYATGSQLPSERTLSADLGVGRTTVRLVLGKLTAAGLIEPQHGRGYFVRSASGDAAADQALNLDRGRPDALRWQTFGERTIYENRPWVRLNLVDVEPPGDGGRFEHHVVRLFSAAIGIVADDSDRILMIWRHRFVSDQWGWEFPGGIVDDGEDAKSAVAREVEEETGWRPTEMHPLISYQPMSGMVDSPHSIYFGRGATYVGEPAASDEAAEVEWIPRSRIPELLDKNLVVGSGSTVGLLHLLAFGFPQF